MNPILQTTEVPPAEDIIQVTERLDHILEWAVLQQNRLGYFPALYRKVTLEVKKKIEQSFFDDQERMERMVTIFANRYFEAFNAFQHQRPCNYCWQLAFEAAAQNRYVVLQHLLIGMNAHINLDLAIAASQVCAADEVDTLQADFNRINDLLASLLDQVNNELTQIWRPFGFLDRIAGRKDEWFINFSMQKARYFAWEAARKLSHMPLEEQRTHIEKMDRRVRTIGWLVLNPGLQMRLLLLLTRRFEKGTVKQIIEILK